MDTEYLGSCYKLAFENLQGFLIDYICDLRKRAEAIKGPTILHNELKILSDGVIKTIDSLKKELEFTEGKWKSERKNNLFETPEKSKGSKFIEPFDDNCELSTDHSDLKVNKSEEQISKLRDEKSELESKVIHLEENKSDLEKNISELRDLCETNLQSQKHYKKLAEQNELCLKSKEKEVADLYDRLNTVKKEIIENEKKSKAITENLLQFLKNRMEQYNKKEISQKISEISQLKREKSDLLEELKAKQTEIMLKEGALSVQERMYTELCSEKNHQSEEIDRLRSTLIQKDSLIKELMLKNESICNKLYDNQDIVSNNIVYRVTDLKSVINIIGILAQYENNQPNDSDTNLVKQYLLETDYFQTLLSGISKILLEDRVETVPEALLDSESFFFRKFSIYDEISLEASRRIIEMLNLAENFINKSIKRNKSIIDDLYQRELERMKSVNQIKLKYLKSSI